MTSLESRTAVRSAVRQLRPQEIAEPMRPYLTMLAGAVAFATMGTLAHALQGVCDWQLVALVRTICVLALAALAAWLGGAKLVFWKPINLWVRSLAGSGSVLLTFYALAKLEAVADVLTLTNMFPIWIAILSWPLLGERPTSSVWISVISGVLGVAIIQQPHLTGDTSGLWAAVGASGTTAVAMLGLHRLKAIDPRAVVVHFSGVSLVVCIGAWFIFDHPVSHPRPFDGVALAVLLGVGVAATIGQILMTMAYSASSSAAKVAVVGLTQVVFALILDILLWGRTLTLSTLVGIALVIGPTAWLMTRKCVPVPEEE